MKKNLLLALLGASAALAAGSSAQAIGYCGPYGHPGPDGICRRNGPIYRPYGPYYGRGPGFVPAFGVFYPGRGYWDGHRYWGHRGRFGGGWRYY